MSEIVFLDFEASSLSDDSWPIEIGLAWIDQKGKLRRVSKLIQPHPAWPISAWSASSEKVHGIQLPELDAAEKAQDVARWAAREIDSGIILSDAPAFDGMWMNRLMETIQQDKIFPVFDVQQAAHSRFDGPSLRMFFRALAKGKSKHRAADDALRLAQAWRAALRKEEKNKDRP